MRFSLGQKRATVGHTITIKVTAGAKGDLTSRHHPRRAQARESRP